MQPDVYNPIIGHGYLGKNMIDSSLFFFLFLFFEKENSSKESTIGEGINAMWPPSI
jgi:hypothetical protein